MKHGLTKHGLMKHRLSINFGPLYGVILALSVGLCVVVGSTVSTAQSSPGGYQCLRLAGREPGTDFLIDSKTGLTLPDSRPLKLSYQLPIIEQVKSPDGKWIAYLLPAGDLSRNTWLYIQPTDIPLTPAKAQSLGEVSEDSVSWSPDSQHFIAYNVSESTYFSEASVFVSLYFLENNQWHNQILDRRPSKFLGWSADGSYFAFLFKNELWSIVSYWSTRDRKSIQFFLLNIFGYVNNYTWSPTQQRLAYLRHLPSADEYGVPKTYLVVATLERHRVVESFVEIPYPEAVSFEWSPDGESIAMRHLLFRVGGWDMYIFHIANQRLQIVTILNILQSASLNMPAGYVWTPDSRTLVYWTARVEVPDTMPWHRLFQLAFYHLDSGVVEKIQEEPAYHWNPLRGPGDYESFRGKQIFMAHEINKRYRVDMMTMTGTQRKTIVQDAFKLGFPMRSPDHNTLAFTWMKYKNGGFENRLIIYEDVYQKFLEISIGRADFRPLLWLPNRRLVFALTIGSAESALVRVGILNFATGEIHFIGKTYLKITGVALDEDSEAILFWAQNRDGSYSIKGYTPTGEQYVSFTYTSSETLEIRQLNRGFSISPNKQGVVFFHASDEHPYFVNSAGKLTVLQSHVIWSPDGSHFATIYDRSPMVVRIYTSAGQLLHEVKPLSASPYRAFWTRCE